MLFAYDFSEISPFFVIYFCRLSSQVIAGHVG